MRGERQLSIFRGNVTTPRSHRRHSAGARQMFYYPSPNRLTVLLKNKQYFSSVFFRLHPSVLLGWWKVVDWQGVARWCHQHWRERENENLISLSFHPNSQTPLTDLETPPTYPAIPPLPGWGESLASPWVFSELGALLPLRSDAGAAELVPIPQTSLGVR